MSSDVKSMAIDGTGRHLAAAGPQGVTVWDLPSGTPLALLPVPPVVADIQFDPSGSLLTSSPLTLRWPISSGLAGTSIGPPQFLQWYQTMHGFSSSKDGKVVAEAIYKGGGLIFDPENPDSSRRFLPHLDTHGIAVSPDGRRVVTCSYPGGTMKVWDTRTGQVLHDFTEVPRRAAGRFSPDGRWMVISVEGRGTELTETTSWSTSMPLGVPRSMVAFSADSSIVAFESNLESHVGSVTLVETSTGRELAQLNDPDDSRAAEIVFSPDGTQLIATLLDRPLIRVWDLRAVRQKLAGLGLDWSPAAGWEPKIPTASADLRSRRASGRVDRGQLDLWLKQANLKRREQALADALAMHGREQERTEIATWLADSCNNLAWELIAGAPANRDPARALPLAQRAVALRPDKETYLNTLGVALYRAARYAEAIPALERSLSARNNLTVPLDLFCLSLCHAKMGDGGRARAHYERAISWARANSELSGVAHEEFQAFRAEAEAALGALHNELPKNIFAKPAS